MQTDALIEFRGDALTALREAVSHSMHTFRVGADMGDVKVKSDEYGWSAPMRSGALARRFCQPAPYVVVEHADADGLWTGTIGDLAAAVGSERDAGIDDGFARARYTIVHHERGVIADATLKCELGPYDDEDWATLTVTISGSHPRSGLGVTLVGHHRVDGRG